MMKAMMVAFIDSINILHVNEDVVIYEERREQASCVIDLSRKMEMSSVTMTA